MIFQTETLQAALAAEQAVEKCFRDIDRISQYNTQKVLEAFWDHRVSEAMLHGTTGYGYDDKGRDTLDSIYAQIFGAEDALVRHHFISGTHTLSTALFGVLRPGDILLSATGTPYDTLAETIGLTGTSGNGSLADYGIRYQQLELTENGVNLSAVDHALRNDPAIKMVFVQRSRGYTCRPALSMKQIGEICKIVAGRAIVMVDNCYGEFTEEKEPTQMGADLIAGSLIKNPGGGLARTGGYIAGRKDLVEKAAYRLTAVGIGKECGASLDELRLMYQGLFLAPHTVAQAMKTAVFAAQLFQNAGYEVSPLPEAPRYDLIQQLTFHDPEVMKAFCRGIQKGSPVDSYVTPEAWDMPGYEDQVIMAAGTFVSGASIELSADGPMRPPYTAYMQGGLTYASGKLALMVAYEEMKKG